MTHPNVEAFFDPATATATFLVWDPETRTAAVIDPVLDYQPSAARLSTHNIDRVLNAADDQGLSIAWVLETHAHADHLSGAKVIAERTGAKIGIGARICEVQTAFRPLFGLDGEGTGPEAFDQLFQDDDRFSLGAMEVQVLHTPGHTPACVSYLIGDAVFVGDTIFMPDFGTARTDFPGGSAHQLFQSIQRLLALPGETRMFVGHDYLPKGRTAPSWETTVEEQRRRNIHVHEGRDEAAFIAEREARDKTLGAPALILPSLQVNIRGGALPPAEANGITYLKIPVDQL